MKKVIVELDGPRERRGQHRLLYNVASITESFISDKSKTTFTYSMLFVGNYISIYIFQNIFRTPHYNKTQTRIRYRIWQWF